MTKSDLFKKVTPGDIFCHYLKLDSFPNKNISSPFSKDERPSFKLFRNGSFKCFSSGKQGDVFQFVADLKNIDCKSNFDKVLNTICTDLNLDLSIQQNHIKNSSGISAIEKTADAVFRIKTQSLKDLHINYFKQYGISDEILKIYNVQAVSYFQFWSEARKEIIKYHVNDNIIAIAYEINDNYEIYIPQQPGAKKFFHNRHKGDDIFGLDQLPEKCDHIIISAGKKDCLALVSNGYYAVTFRSENHYPTDEQISKLQSKLNSKDNTGLFICYDNDFENEDNAGQQAQRKIIERFPFITPILLPANINDVAQLYKNGNNIDKAFEEALAQSEAIRKQAEIAKETKRTIFHIAEEYISAHYNVRYNTIKLEIQVKKIKTLDAGDTWHKLNENSLFVEMQKKGISISVDKLVAILKSDFTPEFNPVKNYFDTLLPWNKAQPDYIANLCSFIKPKDPEQFLLHFKKWMVRTVKCALVPDYFNKQAFIFVSPKQNDGKSTLCRFLCPPALNDYIAEDITNDKDARILLCRNFLINLDELAVLSKQEINSLKAFFSKTQINERLPYDRTNSIIPRIASFIGSTNQDEFLADETGSVRWLCFYIDRIDWAYKKQIDINRVWAQALYLMNDADFECELTRDDIVQNEQRNRDFQILSVERELISKAFAIPKENRLQSVFLTATEIMQHIIATEIIPARGLSKIAIGRAMKQEGYEREKQLGVYGYAVIPLKESTIVKK